MSRPIKRKVGRPRKLQATFYADLLMLFRGARPRRFSVRARWLLASGPLRWFDRSSNVITTIRDDRTLLRAYYQALGKWPQVSAVVAAAVAMVKVTFRGSSSVPIAGPRDVPASSVVITAELPERDTTLTQLHRN